MEPNVGRVNALVRITCGLTMLAWSTAELSRIRRQDGRHLFCLLMGAMKVAEGITRFCPVTKMVTESVSNDKKQTEEFTEFS